MLTWCLNNKYNKTIKEMIIIVALLPIIISVTVIVIMVVILKALA